MDATRCLVAEFTLAPKGGALLRDGTYVAATVQGITAAQQVAAPTTSSSPKPPAGSAASRPALTLVPLAKGTPGALIGAAPGRPGVFAWITIDKSGRLILRRSTAAGEDVVGSVPGGESIYALDHFIVVVAADGDAHLFLLPPSLLDVADDGDAVPRLEPLGVVSTPGGAPDQYIGLAVSTGAADATAAVALFAQHPDDTLHITAVALNGPSPAAEAWSTAIPMPSSALPVSWAVSSDASTVVIVPEAGHAPFIVQAAGLVSSDAVTRSLGAATGTVVGVAAVTGTGFAFAVRPKGAFAERVELVLLPAADALHILPAGGVVGLTMKRATPVAIATRRSPHGGFHCRLLVGRALYAPALHLPSSKAAAAAAAAAAKDGKAAPAATEAPAAPAGTLGLLAALAMSAPVAAAATSAGPSASEVVEHALSNKQFPTNTVVRDPGCAAVTSADGAATHAVVDAIIARAPAATAHEAVARYLDIVRDVDASTLARALLCLAAGVNAAGGDAAAAAADASPRRGSPKRGGSKATSSSAPKPVPAPAASAAATATGYIMQAASDKTRGSFAAAWKASASAAVRAAAAPAVFTALQAVLLHGLTSGRLGVVELAMAAMDGIVAADVDALVAACPETLRDAQSLLATVGAWASSEPGFRLGQLTAHSGPDFALTKEPQVAPLRGHKIETVATIRVDHERQAL